MHHQIIFLADNELLDLDNNIVIVCGGDFTLISHIFNISPHSHCITLALILHSQKRIRMIGRPRERRGCCRRRPWVQIFHVFMLQLIGEAIFRRCRHFGGAAKNLCKNDGFYEAPGYRNLKKVTRLPWQK